MRRRRHHHLAVQVTHHGDAAGAAAGAACHDGIVAVDITAAYTSTSCAAIEFNFDTAMIVGR